MNLEVKNISYQYNEKERMILKDFSFSMTNKERLGLAAPSGVGKTTLCKIIGGYLKPDAGEILLDGKPISQYREYCPIQMIWQQPELAVNPRLRMGDVLEEGDEIEERVIRGLGIEPDWLNRFPAELSGGEMQRFSIARALGKRTKFLLADEISAMLDLITQSQLWNFLLKEVQEREIGLITVSHSQPLLDKICTRQIQLQKYS